MRLWFGIKVAPLDEAHQFETFPSSDIVKMRNLQIGFLLFCTIATFSEALFFDLLKKENIGISEIGQIAGIVAPLILDGKYI